MKLPPGWITKWENIALYCNVHKDTVQKWYKYEGFPVFKLPGGTVCALPHMLDGWLVESNRLREEREKQAQPEQREEPQKKR